MTITKKQTIQTIAGLLIISALVSGAYLFGRQQGTATKKTDDLVTVADKYKEQLPELEAAVKKNSNDPKARRDYAVALYAAGELEKSAEQYKAELNINNSDATIYNNLGNVYRQQSNFDEAIKMYEQAIALDEKNVNAYLNLGHLYANSLNNTDKAIEVYTNGLNKNPDNTTIQSQLARIHERTGNIAQAIQTYKDILKHDPTNTVAQAAILRLEKST